MKRCCLTAMTAGAMLTVCVSMTSFADTYMNDPNGKMVFVTGADENDIAALESQGYTVLENTDQKNEPMIYEGFDDNLIANIKQQYENKSDAEGAHASVHIYGQRGNTIVPAEIIKSIYTEDTNLYVSVHGDDGEKQYGILLQNITSHNTDSTEQDMEFQPFDVGGSVVWEDGECHVNLPDNPELPGGFTMEIKGAQPFWYYTVQYDDGATKDVESDEKGCIRLELKNSDNFVIKERAFDVMDADGNITKLQTVTSDPAIIQQELEVVEPEQKTNSKTALFAVLAAVIMAGCGGAFLLKKK